MFATAAAAVVAAAANWFTATLLAY